MLGQSPNDDLPQDSPKSNEESGSLSESSSSAAGLSADRSLMERQERNIIWRISFQAITHEWFSRFINCVIIANTAILAQDGYRLEREFEENLECANLAFCAIFLLEMLLKMAGLGFNLYVRDNFNIFDSLIVLISLVDIVLHHAL